MILSEMHTGRDSHIDSYGEGYKASIVYLEWLLTIL